MFSAGPPFGLLKSPDPSLQTRTWVFKIQMLIRNSDPHRAAPGPRVRCAPFSQIPALPSTTPGPGLHVGHRKALGPPRGHPEFNPHFLYSLRRQLTPRILDSGSPGPRVWGLITLHPKVRCQPPVLWGWEPLIWIPDSNRTSGDSEPSAASSPPK